MSDNEYALRPVQNEEGTWDALYEGGYGHALGMTENECRIWLYGYDVGASENM